MPIINRNEGRSDGRSRDKTVRVPFGAHRLKLQLSDADKKAMDKAGYVTRWFNDQDGRVERALGGGYEFVVPSEASSLGQGAIHQDNSDIGAKVSKIVSRGDPVIRAYLMKIKKEWFEEDQKVKEQTNALVDEALERGEAGGANVENAYKPGTASGSGSAVTYHKR